MSRRNGSGDGGGITALVWITGPPTAWAPTVVSLRERAPGTRIVVAAPSLGGLVELGTEPDELLKIPSLGRAVDDVERESGHLLLVHAPAIFPTSFIEPALDLADRDLRCSSVSFLSNVGGPASFPVPGVATIHQVDSLDEEAITRRLRAPEGLTPATLPYPVGPAVLLSAQGLSMAGEFPDHGGRVVEHLAQYGAANRSRGMLDFLDPSTFVSHATDDPALFPTDAGLNRDETGVLGLSHPGLALAPTEPSEAHSSLAEALATAHTAVFGIRVLLDGSCLGPKEMGTQVAFMGLARSLAEHPGIAYLGIALATDPPRYAADLLSHPKVDARLAPAGDFSVFPHVDVVHRPFQVTAETDRRSWRAVGRRVVVTVHDLIAFGIPDYHRTAELWFEYRKATRDTASEVDGLIAISEDTRQRIRDERLAIDAERCFVVPDGIGHLRGAEHEAIPEELMARGFSTEPFALVLGANYAHKNRDICVKVVRELRRRGRPLALVMAGALVPHGSSRSTEARQRVAGEPVYVIPDVKSEERNWLFRHAELLLYPTGAEGFGLVPHEAAAFGTPTVLVPFGPFAERLSGLPVAARNWSVDELVSASEALLSDPALARRQVEFLDDLPSAWSWDDVAGATVSVYRSLLARPARFTL